MTVNTDQVHATCVVQQLEHAKAFGLMFLGPSGSGKSDLALRLIDDGWRLVSDDQVLLARSGDEVIARSPAVTYGILEVRNLGIVRLDPVDSAPVRLVVDLDPAFEVPRLPENLSRRICGMSIPMIRLKGFEASAAAKIKLAAKLMSEQAREGVTFPFQIP